MNHVRIEINFLCCELSSNNERCCRADAYINLLRFHRRELILRSLPSNAMRYSTIFHRRGKKYFLINKLYSQVILGQC